MIIAIPSTRRAGKQLTWKNLSAAGRAQTIVVVPEGEEQAYGCRIPAPQVHGIPVRGIGHTRQWILEYAAQHSDDGKVAMFDDDLRFTVRRQDDPTKFRLPTEQDVDAMLHRLSVLLDTHIHASIAVRQGANRKTEPTLYNERMLRVLAFDARKTLAAGVDYGRLEVMEDFDVTLTLLRKGHPCAIVNDYAQDQVASNAPGGCSTYRDFGMQERSALMLAELHAPFVTVVEKKTPNWGKFGGGVRKDVIIQWKRAFDSGEK